MSEQAFIRPLVDLCRAYDALHAGTPIAHASVKPAIDAVAAEIMKLCAAIAGNATVSAADAGSADAAKAATAKTAAATPVPESKPEPMSFAEFSRSLATFVGAHHATVKGVLAARGLSAAMDAAPDDRRAIAEEVAAAVAAEVGHG